MNGHVVAFAEFVPGVIEVGNEGVTFGAGAGYDVHRGGCVSIRESNQGMLELRSCVNVQPLWGW